MGAIVHLDKCCVGKSVRKSCLKCKRQYKRDNHRRVTQLKSEQIPNTRNVTIKKRSKYYEVLCAFCKEKTKKDLCSKCKRNYDCAKNNNYRKFKKKQQPKNKSDTTEQPNQTNSYNPNSIDSVIQECDVNINNRPKRKSIYYDVLCNNCKGKIKKLYCRECKLAYDRAKKKKGSLYTKV